MSQGFAPAVERTTPRAVPLEISALSQGLVDCFKSVEDPRVERGKWHPLSDILIIAILCTIAVGQGWEAMELYGIGRQAWLSTFLVLPHGIPSPDTFRRVIERLHPKQVEAAFEAWVRTLVTDLGVQVIAMDGKKLRGSYDRNNLVERTRQLWNKTTHEIQFYLTSLAFDNPRIGSAIRQHWGLENSQHWVLDVTFGEDASRIRSLHGPQNMAVLRRFALNALNRESSGKKRSLAQKTKLAAMSDDYMVKVLVAALPELSQSISPTT